MGAKIDDLGALCFRRVTGQRQCGRPGPFYRDGQELAPDRKSRRNTTWLITGISQSRPAPRRSSHAPASRAYQPRRKRRDPRQASPMGGPSHWIEPSRVLDPAGLRPRGRLAVRKRHVGRVGQTFWITRGSRSSAQSPPPGLLVSTTSPPCDVAIAWTTARPSPVPPVSRLRDVSSRWKG